METEVIHTTRKGKSILLFFPPYFELFRRINGHRCISHTNSYNNAIITRCHVHGNQRAWATCGLSCLTLSIKLYLRLYFIQIVHSYGKMLFLAPNNCASLTFFKESCVFRHAFPSRLLGPCLLVSKKCYLSVVFAA